MARTCLVIGGSGPTGPWIIDGLLSRGLAVTMMHTGKHRPERAWYDGIDKILANPFDPSDVRQALGGRSWDLAIVTYGRLKDLVLVLKGRVECLITIGGFVLYENFAAPELCQPHGQAVPLREDSPLATTTGDLAGAPTHPNKKIKHVVLAEQAVFAAFPGATHFRYPLIYGPNQVAPVEWCTVRRLLEGKPIVLPDGGANLLTRCYSRNAAEAVLLAVDRPEACRGKAYNVGDDQLLSIRQRVQVMADALGVTAKLISMPADVAACARPVLQAEDSSHIVLSTEALRRDLGYRDVVPAVQALAETARWLASNPVSETVASKVLQDPFDFPAEQQLVDAWNRGDLAACRAVTWRPFSPGYGAFYYGLRENPATGLSQRDRHRGDWTSLAGAAGEGGVAPGSKL